jgi:hypothetical protein
MVGQWVCAWGAAAAASPSASTEASPSASPTRMLPSPSAAAAAWPPPNGVPLQTLFYIPLQLRGRLQCSAPPRVAARQRPCIKALQRAAAWLLMRLRVVLGLRSRLIGLGGRRRCGAADPSHSD